MSGDRDKEKRVGSREVSVEAWQIRGTRRVMLHNVNVSQASAGTVEDAKSHRANEESASFTRASSNGGHAASQIHMYILKVQLSLRTIPTEKMTDGNVAHTLPAL